MSHSTPTLKIAVISTVYFEHSHSDVIVSRWLKPRSTDPDWGWESPRTEIASLYIAQFPDEGDRGKENRFLKPDMGKEMAERYGISLFDTIEGALTLGSNALAVDAVLLIGEHGYYPKNAQGVILYPRKEFFDAIVQVFRSSGRSVPLFCDKHLSWNSAWAQEMVATSKELGFPFMAGSSISLVGVEPEIPVRDEAEYEEYVGVYYCGAEVYGIHSLELMQAFLESRKGDETGIRALTAYTGEAVWEAMERGEWSRDLFEAAVEADNRKSEGDMRVNCSRNPEFDTDPSPTAFVLEYVDGTRATQVYLQGHANNFTMALRYKGEEAIHAACSRTAWGSPANHFGHFATLCRVVEDMFLTGRSIVPIERTLLTTCTIARCVEAMFQPGVRLETPELAISYTNAPQPRLVSPKVIE